MCASGRHTLGTISHNRNAFRKQPSLKLINHIWSNRISKSGRHFDDFLRQFSSMSPQSYQHVTEPHLQPRSDAQYAGTTWTPAYYLSIMTAFNDALARLKSPFYFWRWISALTKPSQVRLDNLTREHKSWIRALAHFIQLRIVDLKQTKQWSQIKFWVSQSKTLRKYNQTERVYRQSL